MSILCKKHALEYGTKDGVISAKIPVEAIGLRKDIPAEDVPCIACELQRARDQLQAAMNVLNRI